MPYFLWFVCAVGFWLLGWSIVIGAALLDRSSADAHPLCLLDGDDFLES